MNILEKDILVRIIDDETNKSIRFKHLYKLIYRKNTLHLEIYITL